MAENKVNSLANGCPSTDGENGDELSGDNGVEPKTTDFNSIMRIVIGESPAMMQEQTVAGLDSEEKSEQVVDPGTVDEKESSDTAATTETTTTTNNAVATSSSTKFMLEDEAEASTVETFVKVVKETDIDESVVSPISKKTETNDADKEIARNVSTDELEEGVKEVSKNSSEDVSPLETEIHSVIESKVENVEGGESETKPEEVEEEPPMIDEVIPEERDKETAAGNGDDHSRPNLTLEITEDTTNHRDLVQTSKKLPEVQCADNKNDEKDDQVEDEDDDDDEEEMENEEPEEVEEEEEDDDEDDENEEDENENEQLELGIVGPPTAVSELINEEELRCSESVLLTEDRGGVESVQDHVAEWVQNSANNKVEELTIDEDENDNDRNEIEAGAEIVGDNNLQKIQTKNTDNQEKNAEVLATRKSKRVVSNIIKRSIKCLNKIHAMDASAGVIKASEKSGKKVEKISAREEETVPAKLAKEQRGRGMIVEERETTTAPRNHRDRRNHHNHSNNRRNGGERPEDGGEAYCSVKKEPASEPETDPEPERDALPELRKKTGSDRQKNLKTERESKKRRSTDDIQTSNGSSKRACLEQREEFISSLVGSEKVTTEELTVRAEQLRAELQALDQLARAKEKEWNEILSMRKLKEEAYLRIERRRQVVGFMEGNGQLNETSVIPAASLSLEPEWDNAKEKSNSTEATLSDKSITRPQVTSKQNENGQKESLDGQNSENRQIGEGRQGPMVDVRTIIADYRLRHPETVPRRSRRMRNSVNVGLGAGGAMVETSHVGADSRPSSTDSCKSSSNATDPSNSMSFKDVLVQFAKLSQQQGEAVKTPQNYPDVTLHPVLPSPAAPQTAAIQQSGSLLHGILTKSQSPRPTTFSPTLARLLTAPERDRCNPIATSTPQQATATQHLLQAYQGTNPVSISDLLSSSKARTEITITPVVNTPSVQSHSNSLIHVEDVEEETSVIEERGRSSNARDDSPPRCQGCQDRAAQFVCAGCGNQWYCSRECQVSAWDEHSEVCSG